jgi:hypothetical protein
MRLMTRRFALLLLLILGGCSARLQVPAVIAEGDYRLPQPPAPQTQEERQAKEWADRAAARRIPLHLEDDSVRLILRFIEAGGNAQNMKDGTVVDPRPETAYGELLALLRRDLTKEAIVKQRVLEKWLPGPPVYGAVDARIQTPPADLPLALHDARYWWIFYPNSQGQLTGLVITKLVQPPRRKREAN